MSETPELTVERQPAARRFEVYVGGELAGLVDYRERDGVVVFPHVEVYPRYESQGVGTQLVRSALDEVIGEGKQIQPDCPFVAEFVRSNPSYAEHVAS